MRELLGETTFDVWLNSKACWRNVPAKVWRYRLGGYQVIKKWLSYREADVLGRALKPQEAGYVQEVVRRLAAILLMGPALDSNYAAVKTGTYPWPRAVRPERPAASTAAGSPTVAYPVLR